MGLDPDERATLRRIADYQFGPGAGVALFPEGEAVELHRTSSGRISQVRVPAGRLVSYGVDGRFTLGLAGGKRLREAGDGYGVVVGSESEPFLREGRNAFAKFVTDVDPAVRPRDEVYVVGPPAGADDANDADGTPQERPDAVARDDDSRPLLAVGRAELSADAILRFETGVAVSVREGGDADETGA